MPTSHRHRVESESIQGYTGGVAPGGRYPQNPAAAGGICTVQRCRCGAVRKINSNGRHEERGPWIESQHGGARPGAGRKPTTGTGRLLRLSPPLLNRVADLATRGDTPQEHIADLCDQVERARG